MVYQGSIHEFVYWFFSPAATSEPSLEGALRTIPDRDWGRTRYNLRQMLAEEFRWLHEAAAEVHDEAEQRLIDMEAAILTLKGLLIAREQVRRERQPQPHLTA